MNILAWPSLNDLPESVRVKMIALLNRQLAAAIDLGLQAKQAHWNVKGPQFVALHELFDGAAQSFNELADELAERAVELGGVANGSLQVVAGASQIPEYNCSLLAGSDHLKALGAALLVFTGSTRAAIDAAATAGDATTADLFTEVSRGIDKLLWKLTAHGAALS